MIIVDSNVLIDILEQDPRWAQWSLQQLEGDRRLDICINPVIYAEIAPQFAHASEIDGFLSATRVGVKEFTRPELLAAGKTHARYRASGGERRRVLSDFLIGAQAALSGRALLTRDPKVFRSYFPQVRLITP